MDLISVLPRVVARRPPVLLVALPGATRERLAVEAELTRRGWPSAAGPAAAAGLVVAGRPGGVPPRWLGDLWNGVPRPKAYAGVAHADEAPHALDLLGRLLAAGREGDAPRAVSTNAPAARGAMGSRTGAAVAARTITRKRGAARLATAGTAGTTGTTGTAGTTEITRTTGTAGKAAAAGKAGTAAGRSRAMAGIEVEWPAGCRWPGVPMTVTACGWTGCIFRWDRHSRTGRRAWSWMSHSRETCSSRPRNTR
ncbi:hypothetical protein [Streptomyces sp. I6]|uniref:hypothetical protein n=1 Tax=Streptomyces sp. I6 TaxID=2483113 RepID=UPI0037DA18E6